MENMIEKVLITEEQLQARIRELGEELTKEYADKDPIVVGVLKGVVVFYADMYGNGDWCAVTSVGRVESKYGNETTAELQVTKHNEEIAYA